MSDELAREFTENKEDRCPVIFVLDTSSSMLTNGAIHALNDSLKSFGDQALKDPVALMRMEVCIISFGDVVKVETNFSSLSNLQLAQFEAKGGSPMGAAMRRALKELDERKAIYRAHGVNYFRPMMILITNGAPTDEWRDAAREVAQHEADWKSMVFAVGVSGADETVLSEFSKQRPPLKLNGLAFEEMFQWFSPSVIRTSTGEAGSGGKVELPPIDGWSEPYS